MAKKSRSRSRSRARSASARKSAPSTPSKKSTASPPPSTSIFSKIKSSIPPLPFTLPEWSPDLFNAVAAKGAPRRAASRVVVSFTRAKSKLAHPRPGILSGDEERHVAIAVLGLALLLWLAAAVFGAVFGDGGACVAGGKRGGGISSSSSSSSLAAAASCVRGGKLPLLWFDGILRSLGPLLALPLLLSRVVVAHRSAAIGGGGVSSSAAASRPLAHFTHVLAVYAAAAAARLGLYLPHRSGLLARAAEGVAWLVALPFRTVFAGLFGRAAASPSSSSSSPLAVVRGFASRAAAAAAPVTSLLPLGFGPSSSSSSTTTAATKHLMSDHLFLGSCVGAMLVAEGVLLVSDARRHGKSKSKSKGGGGGSKTNHRLLLAGAAACAVLYGALCADMAFTAAYFHARHETAAAVLAGLVAFQAPLAVWLLGGVAGARRAARGFFARGRLFSSSRRR